MNLPNVENRLLVATTVDDITRSDPRRHIHFVITFRRFLFNSTVTAALILITAGHGSVRSERLMFFTITLSGKTFFMSTVSLLVVTVVIRVATTIVINV